MIRMIFAGLVVCLTATGTLARDFFVAPASTLSKENASSADGTSDKPFKSVWAAVSSGMVSGGDRIVLRDGEYGTIKIARGSFDPPIEIVAENIGRAHADSIFIQGGRGLHFRGMSVWPKTRGSGPRNLITTGGNAAGIYFDAMDIRGVRDAPETYMTWSKDQWNKIGSNGVALKGPENRLTNSKITGVSFGVTTWGDKTVVAGNQVEGFGGDAMRGLGDGSVFAGNVVKNCFKVNENHDDGFQSWATKPDADGRKTVSDLVIENNIILEWTGPANHSLRCKLQGIGLFDGIYKNFTIRNNLIAISAYHGIALYAGTDSRIVNNTVVNISGGPAKNPWIMLSDNRNGWKAGETLVSNNVAMSFKGISRAAQRNAIASYPAKFFRNAAQLDFRLMAGSPLIDAGTAEGAPRTDIIGTPRSGRPDLGAFEMR